MSAFDAIVPSTGEVIEFRNGQPAVRGASFSTTGLALDDSLSFDAWQSIGETLRAMERSVMWWIGDWVRFGERRYGEMYAQALDVTGYSYQTAADAKWVASKIEFSRRRENLSFSHHREIAALPAFEADALLDAAASEGWSKNELRAEVSRRKNRIGSPPSADTCEVKDLGEAVRLGKKFGTIYADPPWVYDNQGTRAATSNHYLGLTVDQLCELPVADLAASDAHLHLWTTNAFLFDCDRLMKAWGFEFRSTFVWCKSEFGIGNYWRNSHEILLTGIRGNAKRFNDHTLKSWLECGRGEHSAKPEQVRKFIERASPGPYLEMFARSPADGWAVWGNEVERGLFFQNLREVA